MPVQLQMRRGTKALNDAFTGSDGEITVNTDSKSLRSHDGAKAGGYELGMAQANGMTNLRTHTPAIGARRYLTHHTTDGDGGHGVFRAVMGGYLAAQDNNGTVIVVGVNAWVREFIGAFNVKWFGAVGDDIADDTIALQACFNYSGAASIFIPKGVYKTTSQLTIIRRVIVFGEGTSSYDPLGAGAGVPAGSCIKAYHNGVAVLSLKGAGLCNLSHFSLLTDTVIYPKTGLILGRSSGSSSGRHETNNILVAGYFSVAAVYSIASEENRHFYMNAHVLGGSATAALIISDNDLYAVDGLVKSSNFEGNFFGGWFYHQAQVNSSHSILIYGHCAGFNFFGGFSGMISGTTSSNVLIHAYADAVHPNAIVNLKFSGMSHENSSNASPPIQFFYIEGEGAGSTIKGLDIDKNTFGQYLGGTQYAVYQHPTAFLEGSTIDLPKANNKSLFSKCTDCSLTVDMPMNIDTSSTSNIIQASAGLFDIINLDSFIDSNDVKGVAFQRPSFTGVGIDALTIGVSTKYTGTRNRRFLIKIETTTAPNKFVWSCNNGISWTTGIAITSTDQLLLDGVYIKFSQITGLAIGDLWAFSVATDSMKSSYKLESALVKGGKSYSVSTTSVDILNVNEPVTTIIGYATITGYQAANFFIDKITYLYGAVVVASSVSIMGSPSARTYGWNAATQSITMKMALNTSAVVVTATEHHHG